MQVKGNFFSDNEEINWHLNHRVSFEELFEWVPDAQKEALGVSSWEEYQSTWLEVLNTIGEYAGSTLQSNAEKVQKEDLVLEDGEVKFPPAISENVKVFKEIGGPPLAIDYRYGGLSAPLILEFVSSEMISRACPSTYLNVVWYGSIAQVIEKFGSEEQKEEWCTQIAEGSVSGSMSLTEPDIGSDLANVRTYGTKQEDGTWKVYGNKQFISNGSGEVSLVLAKNEKGAKGLKSLNIFIVPRLVDGKQNFKVAKLEEKPGLHGSATCALEFDGSVGYLLGKNGEGFMYMLHLMNEARVAVAFQGLGLMEACYRLAKDFAAERKAFGKPIERHELIAEKLLDMDVEIKAHRSLCYQAAYYASLIEMGQRKLKNEKLSDAEQKKISKKVAHLNKRLRDWTPLIKYMAGERSYTMARDSLQIHGGYGFTTEYKPEWLVRESLILSIYEGTSQIQALMCMKDTLKQVMRDPTGFAEIAMGMKMKGLSETNTLKRKVYKMRQIQNSAILSVLYRLVRENARSQYNASKKGDILKMIKALSTEILKFDNISPALLHAERVCEIKAVVSAARCLVWDAEKDPSRTWIAERYMNKNLPLILKLQGEIEMDDSVIAKRLSELHAVDKEEAETA